MSCAGHALNAGGTLFVAGETLSAFDLDLNDSNNPACLYLGGIAESFSYNPVYDSWVQHVDGIGAFAPPTLLTRWYPDVTRLADDRMLISGGYEQVLPVETAIYSDSLEIYDPVTDTHSVTPDYLVLPSVKRRWRKRVGILRLRYCFPLDE